METRNLDRFTAAYIETLFWAETDGDGRPLDANYSAADLAPEALAAIVADCAAFQAANGDDISAGRIRRPGAGYSETEYAGHDFLLTRNRHGAGFWDGDWPEGAAERLTAAAHSFGETAPYIGDDGRVYLA